MLTEAQIAQFHANGFLNGGQVLTDEEVEVLRSEVMRTIDERERSRYSAATSHAMRVARSGRSSTSGCPAIPSTR